MDSGLLMDMEKRAKGQFPISIATSLGLEGAFGILEEGPRFKVPPIREYQEIWINLRTLFRNFEGALDKDTRGNISANESAQILLDEMAFLVHHLSDMRVHFYACSYKSLSRLYPNAQFKEVNTDKQKIYARMENDTLEILFRSPRLYGMSIKGFDVNLTPDGAKASKSLIMTHYPFDLLSYKNFNVLALLESHTGVIKQRGQWYTKLNGGNSLERIPFDKMTVQLFGDSGKLIRPYPPAYRDEFLKVAEKYQLNSLSTESRIKQCVQIHRNASLLILVTKLYS